jgi:hypothetical protein
MAENCIIGTPRWTGRATFTGGSWHVTYPVSNLKRLPLSYVARSTDALAASTQFVATLSEDSPVRLIALVRHNLTLAATFRVRLYSDAGLTELVYDSEVIDVWPVVYPASTIEWEDNNWFTGKYTDEEIAGYVWTRPLWLGAVYIARAIKVEIFDATNPAGYVEVGLCEIAQGWQASVNFAYGLEHGFESRSEGQEALGGEMYFDRRPLKRLARGEIRMLPHDEAMAKGGEFFRRHDKAEPFLWFPFPDTQVHWVRDTYLARNAELPLMALARFGRDRFPFSFREV